MEAVREAYADMRTTAEAAQAQLSELQTAEKGLQEQLNLCAQQVSHTAMRYISSAVCLCSSIHRLVVLLRTLVQHRLLFIYESQLYCGCKLRMGKIRTVCLLPGTS